MRKRKVAIVTGSTDGGAGRSIALALAREGFDIVINNRKDEEAALKVAELIRRYGVEALILHADITNSEQVNQLVQQTVNHFGRIDVLVVNPGGGWAPSDLHKVDIKSFRQTLDVETIGPVICCKYVLPVMRRQASGCVVLISMEDTDIPRVPSWAPYDYIIGKSTRIYLARALAEREKEYGITVNAICPTAFPHVSEEEAVAMNQAEEAWINRKKSSPQDAAEAVVYLASETGRFVTGSMLQIKEVKRKNTV